MKKSSPTPFISVIFPCFNEEESIVSSVLNAKKALAVYIKNHKAEIIVVENNSTDRSAYLAKKAGAKVIKETVKGYGAALKTGFSRAKGDILIMADADNTYPLADIPKFIRETQKGADMVLGSRFQGTMSPGAMPFFNRYIGNPILTGLLNLFYGTKISDTQTGMRALTKKAWLTLRMKSDGMEFASEMIIKAIAFNIKISEIPISYRQRVGISKLSPIRDAIRHILSIFIYSPTYALILPGFISWIIGMIGMIFLTPQAIITPFHTFDIHSLITAILLAGIGLNMVLSGLIVRLHTVRILEIPGGWLSRFLEKHISAEILAIPGIIHVCMGVAYYLWIVLFWISNDFGPLKKSRELFTATGLCMMGSELIIGSILYSLFINIKVSKNERSRI